MINFKVRAVYLSINFNHFIIVFSTNGNLYLCDVKPETYVPIQYPKLYNNKINARVLIGQSAMVYCAGKPMEESRGS